MKSTAPPLAGIILAAGASSRMGRPKALLPYPAALAPVAGWKPPAHPVFLSACGYKLLAACHRIWIVLGRQAAMIRSHPDAPPRDWPIEWLENPDPDRGQFSSLQTAVAAVLAAHESAAAVALVDRPAFAAATVLALAAAQPWAAVVKPVHAGRGGHPVLYRLPMLAAIAAAPPGANARMLAGQLDLTSLAVSVTDPGVLLNLDDPGQYGRWAASVAASAPEPEGGRTGTP